MIRLSAYLVLMVVTALLLREAATWAWDAYNAPVMVAGKVPPPAPDTKAGDSPSAPKIAELDRPPLTAFPQTSSRPLFFEGRRYPEREPPKKVVRQQDDRPPPVNISQLKLLGVRISSGVSQALIAIGGQPPDWINVGENVTAWTVRSVDTNNVSLEHDGQTADLRLYEP